MRLNSSVDIRHLAALIAAADEGSFSRAAVALGFTQSAVSQQIASLERAVGASMFERRKGPRAAALTPVGTLVLDHARKIFAQLHLMEDDLDRIHSGMPTQLVIGTFQSVSAKILPAILGPLQDEAPEVEIRLFESDSQELLLRKILDDELDLSFTIDAELDSRLASTILGYDPFVVIAQRCDLTGPTARSLDLHEQALIGHPESSVCQKLVDQRLTPLGIRPRYVCRTVDNGAVQAMVRAGMGRAVMPYLSVDGDDPDIEVFNIEPRIAPRTVRLTRRVGRPLPPAAQRFEEIAVAVSDVILQAGSIAFTVVAQ